MKLQYKGHEINIFLLIILICIFSIIFLIFRPSVIQRISVIQNHDRYVYNLIDGERVEYEFVSDVDNLSSFSILFITFGRKNSGKLEISMKDENGKTLFSEEVLVSLIKDNQFYNFYFPQIKKSRLKKFKLEINPVESTVDDCVSVYLIDSNDGSSITLNDGTKNMKVISKYQGTIKTSGRIWYFLVVIAICVVGLSYEDKYFK